MSETISQSLMRLDAPDKIAGRAKYVADLKMKDCLFALTVRSPIAKGKILQVSLPAMPEGYQVVDHRDIPGENIVKIIYDDQVIFPVDEVKYIGQPILLVVGPDKRIVERLAKAIKIEFREEQPVFAWENSVIRYQFTKGEGDAPFASAANTISYTYTTGYQEQAYMEPQGFIGHYDRGKIVLVGSIQCPYYVKNALIRALACDPDKVRVIQAAVGGAFGGKEEYPSLIACELAVAINKIKKPIKLIFEREEDMLVTTKRHPAQIKLAAAIGADGAIRALRAHVGIDAGADIGLSGVVLSRAMIAATGAYTIDNLAVSGDVYLTNTVPTGAFRGFGAPQMLFAIEMFIEHIAKDLGRDPLAYRLDYLAKQHDKTSTSGVFRDPILMPEMVEKAMAMSGYAAKSERYPREAGYRGIGMSFFLHGCGFTGSGEAKTIKAKVKLEKDSEDLVHILIAAVDMGQGVHTAMRKLVASIMEIPIETVIYDYPDTDQVPDSGPTVASRTMMIVGGLVARAARALKESFIPGQHQVAEEQYVQPDYIKWDEDTMQGDAYPAYSWGVTVVEVAVDPHTYQVNLEHAWSVYDCGKAIDELMVLGQADGGLAQGIAYGCLEVMEHDQGKIRQKNLTDYIIPTASDVPAMTTMLIDNPYPLGPYGAKGVGELTLVGGAPAVAKAIEMAINKRITKIPATPEAIMELIKHG